MPLRVRCPHCRQIAVAPEEAAGERMACPACKRLFQLPLPRAALEPAAAPSGAGAPRCPRCRTEVAPNAVVCHRCHTDLRTGKRLPLKERLRRASWRFWAKAAFLACLVAIAALAGVRAYRIHTRPPSVSPVPTSVPVTTVSTEPAERLLSAATPAELEAAQAALRGQEVPLAPAVADALAESLGRRPSMQLGWNQLAAIELLARYGDAHPDSRAKWIGVLERCGETPQLRTAALRARGLLGDVRAAPELRELWLAHLERALFLARLGKLTAAGPGTPVRQITQTTQQELARLGDSLRAVARQDEAAVLDPLVTAWWGSWRWLGQGPGDEAAAALFGLAQSGDASLRFDPNEVRQPRDALARVAERGSPAARAAAGLILKERAPQYRSLLERVASVLGSVLPAAEAADQQRLTWVIARLRGRQFGAGSHEHPLELGAAEVAAAQQWLAPGERPVVRAAYPQPPVLVYRATPAELLLERELLGEFEGGWTAANRALDRWLAADLPCGPRVLPLLRAGQRRPNYPAVAAAFVVASTQCPEGIIPQLELWLEAREQPAWVRALAYTALASVELRRGRGGREWPAALELGDVAMLEAGEPGWDHFGYVIAAGGTEMRERLKASNLPPLVRDRLLIAAEQAARRFRFAAP